MDLFSFPYLSIFHVFNGVLLKPAAAGWLALLPPSKKVCGSKVGSSQTFGFPPTV